MSIISRFMTNVTLAMAVVAGTAVVSNSSSASVIKYDSLTSFLGDASTVEVTFIGLAAPAYWTFFGSSLTRGGLTFTDPGSKLFVIDPQYPAFSLINGDPVLTSYNGTNITIGLPANINAVGFTLGAKHNTTAAITLSTGDVFNVPVGWLIFDFYGFVSNSAYISSITIASADNYPATESVYIGSASATPPLSTPLPSTWLMLLSGFVSLGFLAYRGTKKNAAALAA